MTNLCPLSISLEHEVKASQDEVIWVFECGQIFQNRNLCLLFQIERKQSAGHRDLHEALVVLRVQLVVRDVQWVA